MKHLVRCLLIVIAMSLALTSCKAWRTVTTSATYIQQNDSVKSTTTIQTKTQEEYTGVRKNR
jgi:uncharacterized protein YxeA